MDHEEMANSLVREIQSLLTMSSITNIRSIYFGGGEHFEVVMDAYVAIVTITGTPSLATASTVEKVINAVAINSRLDPNAEISLEANPTSSEMSKLR